MWSFYIVSFCHCRLKYTMKEGFGQGIWKNTIIILWLSKSFPALMFIYLSTVWDVHYLEWELLYGVMSLVHYLLHLWICLLSHLLRYLFSHSCLAFQSVSCTMNWIAIFFSFLISCIYFMSWTILDSIKQLIVCSYVLWLHWTTLILYYLLRCKQLGPFLLLCFHKNIVSKLVCTSQECVPARFRKMIPLLDFSKFFRYCSFQKHGVGCIQTSLCLWKPFCSKTPKELCIKTGL